MGSVYRVFDLVDKQERSLKILHEGVAQGEGGERFLREIEILSRINHPGVPRVYSWGGQDTQLYFVAEYVRGHDLKTKMKLRNIWPPEEAASLIASVAEALAQAHAQSIVHRDVKPQNIVIADDGSVKLLDFGVAHARGEGMRTLTKTGMVLGTPEYMSPEQFEGKKVEPPSDVYALGVILYQLLTRDPPFSGNRMEIAIRILTESVSPPRLIRNGIPVWLDRIVMKCLQRDLKKRYPSAAELAADLKSTRESGKPKMNWLEGGDGVLEDPSGSWEWDLVLSSSKEKEDWVEGIGLRFSDMLYKLRKISPPDETMRRWTYHFSYWPKGEVVRRLLDY
jgi:serine/threonine-protein kinase